MSKKFEQQNHKELLESIKRNKKEEKIARERILDEIKADRERVNLLKQPIPVPSTVEGICPSKRKINNGSDITIIQIRKLDGSRDKVTLSQDDTLEQLWTKIETDTGMNGQQYLLVQPFPRAVFGASHMRSTLKELGLCPSGNLVFEKMNAEDMAFLWPEGAISLDDKDNQSEPCISGDEVLISDNNDETEDHNQHIENGDSGEEDVEDGDFYDRDEEERIDEENVDNDFHPAEQELVFRNNRDEGHVWGVGHSLLRMNFGVPDRSYENRDFRELAAEAVTRRIVVQQHKENERSASSTSPPDFFSPPSLLEMTFGVIKSILMGPQPPYSLWGMPTTLAEKMIQDIIKEGNLRPNHLRPFVKCYLSRIDLNSYTYCTNDLLYALRPHACLCAITLKNCSLITDEGIKYLSSLKQLNTLILSGCNQISNNVIPTLIALTSLTTLELERTSITDRGLVQLCQSRPTNLAYLNLKGTSITEKALVHLKLIPNLKKLSLEACPISDIEGLEDVASLVDLNLSYTWVTTEGVSRIEKMTQLKRLVLSNTAEVSSNRALSYLANLKLTEFQLPNRLTLTDRGLPFISKMPLQSLDLSHYIYITDDSMYHIGRMISLRKLFLTNTKITDQGLSHLKHLKSLRVLHLDRVSMTDNGSVVLKSLRELRELSLSITNVSDEFIIRGYLDECRLILKLNLSKTLLTSEGLLRLRLPSLKFINIDETYVNPSALLDLPGHWDSCKITYKTLRRASREEQE